MTDGAKIVSLVAAAIDKTRNGQMSWEPSFEEGRFTTLSEFGGLTIEHAREADFADGVPAEWYDLSVLNRDGYPAIRYSTAPQLSVNAAIDAPRESDLQTLFQVARENRSESVV